MSVKLDPAHLDHAIELYLAGKPLQEIQATSGVSLSRMHAERRARGIPPRGRRELPLDDVIRAYMSGVSENALAAQYGVSRGVIAQRLTEAGVERRGLSDAGKARNARMTEAERHAQVTAAHEASRKRRVPQIQKLRQALAREAAGHFDSPGEARLYEMLKHRGVHATPQRAVGQYNVDLAVLPVAMEVLGGGWHAVRTTHAERTPQILDAGWHLVMVWDYEGRSALGAGAADYLVAFLDQVRRQPPATSQYRVISGQGELLAATGRERDEFPLEPPPRGCL